VITTIVAINRAIVHRTRGHKQGTGTRLVSPGGLGELLKPFVFLDLASFDATVGNPWFPMHPHSGITTLTNLNKSVPLASLSPKPGNYYDNSNSNNPNRCWNH
jgi:redox-sensitive bicupin YhaK (pirin superfamily)